MWIRLGRELEMAALATTVSYRPSCALILDTGLLRLALKFDFAGAAQTPS